MLIGRRQQRLPGRPEIPGGKVVHRDQRRRCILVSQRAGQRQRLKLSGMHWSVRGASAIATLRCQQASRPEDRVWNTPRNHTGAA
jgi:hypothetical protein